MAQYIVKTVLYYHLENVGSGWGMGIGISHRKTDSETDLVTQFSKKRTHHSITLVYLLNP